MKQLKKDLDTVLKELKTLTRKTEGMGEKNRQAWQNKGCKKVKV